MPSRRSREPAPLKFPPSPELAPLWQRLVDFTTQLPGAEESRSYGTPSLKVKGKLIARLRSEAEGRVALRCDMDLRAGLLEADPGAFSVTDHYQDYPMVLVDLETVDEGALKDLVEQAWRELAPRKLLDQLD